MLNQLQGFYRLARRADREYARKCSEPPRHPTDPALRFLGAFADHSKLWFSLTGIFAARKGSSRRAAARGVIGTRPRRAVSGAP